MVDPCRPWLLIIFLDCCSPGLGLWDFFSYLIYLVVVLMRHFGGMGVYTFHSHRWWLFLPLCRAMSVLLLLFELDKVGVVVDFLLVYPLVLYFWVGILFWYPARSFIFFLISLLRKCVCWWMPCNSLSGILHGNLFVRSRWSRILSFPIVGKHV